MEAAGYEKTANQCNNKIRKLKLEYRKTKDSTKKTGTGRKDWKYFEDQDGRSFGPQASDTTTCSCGIGKQLQLIAQLEMRKEKV